MRGLGLINPSDSADAECSAPIRVSAPLVSKIEAQYQETPKALGTRLYYEVKLQVKSASFSTDNDQKSRFSFSYRISNNKNFIAKYLDNAPKVLLKLHKHRGDRI